MKKTISFILAAVVLLTMLTACGGKAPAEPAETALYGKVTMENAPANALGAVVYLGYYESADAMKAELPETLKDLPLAEMGGGEAYAIIPRFEGESVTLYAVTMKENATAERAENGTAYDGAVLLMCNESDIDGRQTDGKEKSDKAENPVEGGIIRIVIIIVSRGKIF